MDNNAQGPKAARIALMALLCLSIFGSGVLRSYQAGVEAQAARTFHEVNSPAALAAVQNQMHLAKNIRK